MYRIQVTGGYDTYGRPASHVDIAVPRGHDPRRPDPGGAEPYLAVLTATTYATRDDPASYLTDRVTSTRRDELSATTAAPALGVANAALAGTRPRGAAVAVVHLLRRPARSRARRARRAARRPAVRAARRPRPAGPHRTARDHPRAAHRRQPAR